LTNYEDIILEEQLAITFSQSFTSHDASIDEATHPKPIKEPTMAKMPVPVPMINISCVHSIIAD
jgi:hypothetical protein